MMNTKFIQKFVSPAHVSYIYRKKDNRGKSSTKSSCLGIFSSEKIFRNTQNYKRFIKVVFTTFLMIFAQIAASDNLAEYGPVKAQDNLWNIAKQAYASQGITVEQGSIAIYKANPESFSHACNPASFLKQGVILRIPPPSKAAEITTISAANLYQEYIKAWKHFRLGKINTPCPPAQRIEAITAHEPSNNSPVPSIKPPSQSVDHTKTTAIQPLKSYATTQNNVAQTATTEDSLKSEFTSPSPSKHTPSTDRNKDISGQKITQPTVLTYQHLKDWEHEINPDLTAAQKNMLISNAIADHNLLAIAWAVAVFLSVAIYLILDGSDLGAGVLSLAFNDTQTRGAIMSSMAGTWDANETWLVVAGGILFGSFPFIYGSVFHFLLIPLMILLLGIITRAIALEFRHYAVKHKRSWGWAFGISSLVVSFIIGTMGGALLDGVPMTERSVSYAGGGILKTFSGSPLDFLSIYSVWTGLVGVLTSVLAGTIYLRARFEKSTLLRKTLRPWANYSLYLFIGALLITLVWGVFRHPWLSVKLGADSAEWFILPALWIAWSFYQTHHAVNHEKDGAAMAWFALSIGSILATTGALLYPWIIPGSWTIFDSADPSLSLTSVTLGLGGFIPVMLAYNWYQLYVFRARITHLGEYGEE